MTSVRALDFSEPHVLRNTKEFKAADAELDRLSDADPAPGSAAYDRLPSYSFRVLWSDDDDAYVATSPEFDGISGIGETADAAVKEAQAAVLLALETYHEEGWPLPPPSR